MKLCEKCHKNPVPLMRRVCNDCKKKYMKQYKQAYAWRLKNYNREYMRDKRWLNGGPDKHLMEA